MKTILRVLWGRRLVIFTAVAAALLGGLTVVAQSAPRYQGTARVVLDYIRPDPTTGAVLPSKMLDAYITSQISMLRDFQVTGPAVEAMGFLENPDVQQAYYANSSPEGRDLHAWIAAQVAAAVSGRMVDDSNVLEIRYVGSSPEMAEAMVDALRAAFIESSVRQTRAAALQQADILASRIETARATFAKLQALQHRLEDETGLMMGEKGRDEESAKLAQLMGRQKDPVVIASVRPSAAATLLREIDQRIAEASTQLGVNNPQLIALRQRRIALEAQAAADAERAGTSSQIAQANERAVYDAVERQKARVLAAREPTLRLRIMQDEINRQREQINALTEALVKARNLAGADNSTTTPIGPAVAKREPVFPNMPLIFGGTGGLGLLVGCLLAMLIEASSRRIRAISDLQALTGAPVLAAIPTQSPLVWQSVPDRLSVWPRRRHDLPAVAAE